jgi:hypothetical protein
VSLKNVRLLALAVVAIIAAAVVSPAAASADMTRGMMAWALARQFETADFSRLRDGDAELVKKFFVE